MVDPEALGGTEFQKCTQCLKRNQISLAYHPTNNKDQTFITKSCFVFLLYREICRGILCHSLALRAGTAEFGPLGSVFEVHGSRLRLMCVNQHNLKTTSVQVIPKCACKSSPAYANYITNSNNLTSSNHHHHHQSHTSKIPTKRSGVGVEAV